MKIRIFQKGFNYSQDGRGNRLVLHLQGCNMHCPWCSNPEGMPLEGALLTQKEWLDESCCPKGAVREGLLCRQMCISCKEKPCVTKRRQRGIRLSCQEYSVDEIVKECEAAKPVFFEGGGVTLTGGEISMQFAGVRELLEKLGKKGIHRAIECNGSHPGMEELIPCVEQWIMDVKHYDEEVHREWIGVSNEWTLRNLERISAKHPDVLIRVPLIPGFNDSREDAEGFGQLFREKLHGENTRVEFLLYHEYGRDKWAQCGMEYKMKPGHLPPGIREFFEDRMKAYGIVCMRT